jgi:paraquat-inducible protein A
MTFSSLSSLGHGGPSTIIGGVKELIAANMWPLALIVFVASILVPMLKMAFLGYLLISVRRRSRWRLKDRSLIYRIVEAVGRWSMVDVFVVSVLASPSFSWDRSPTSHRTSALLPSRALSCLP